MTPPFAEVYSSPLLVDLYDEIARKLAQERVARMRLRDAMDEDRRDEFINGEVVTQITNKFGHADVLRRLESLIGNFVSVRILGQTARQNVLVEFPRNDYCPDLCFWSLSRLSMRDPERKVFPPPDFIIEVLSESTEHRDRGVKFEDYQAHGVREYWIVDPDRRIIEQYIARDGVYTRQTPTADGLIRSDAVPGLAFPALAAFDDAAQTAALRMILSAM